MSAVRNRYRNEAGNCTRCGKEGVPVVATDSERIYCYACAGETPPRTPPRPLRAVEHEPAALNDNTEPPPQSPPKQRPKVTFTDDRTPKLVLPDVPAHDDMPGLLAWLSAVFQLDPQHPATGAVLQGLRGPDAHVELRRANTRPIRFEPISLVYQSNRFRPALRTHLLPTDGKPYGFKGEHCDTIAHVLLLACGACTAPAAEQEAAAIVGTFIGYAEAVNGYTTYGTTAQRYEAASELVSIDRLPRYLIDANTGEHVIRVSDLQEAGRKHMGSALAHGWLDGRMEALGWARVPLDGHQTAGRTGRTGPHQRCLIYRGILPTDPEPKGTVTT